MHNTMEMLDTLLQIPIPFDHRDQDRQFEPNSTGRLRLTSTVP